MKKFRTLLLDKKNIKALLKMEEAVSAVEEVFREHGLNKTQMPPKIYLNLEKYHGDFRAMPAYAQKIDKCVLKWVNVHPNNKKFGLPTVMAVIILSEPKNGFPLCIMNGTVITSLRTGAAGAVAAKYLARKDSKVVAMVGCGEQAKTQLEGLRLLFDIREIKLWSNDSYSGRDFMQKMKTGKEKMAVYKSVKDCVSASDIVVTTTPSRKPIVRYEWLKNGCHINAIGADSKGKEELSPLILKKSKVVVDSFAQAHHSGEINVPLSRGVITRKNIYAELGEIICGKIKGRVNNSEITVFDSTGLAIQDLAVASLAYRLALRKKAGISFDFLGLK
ncbi:MAG: alanine dehydrogenase [Candidatus Omnitrophica bacterium]|nr:alanine dehydrogenase [Candidatus Omnitrophota bacterium]